MIKHISTNDGSSSLFVEELNETYHSRHGALQESEFVFIKEGLKQLPERPNLNVLEVGMGTGLNVLLSCNYALQYKRKISLVTLEPFPVSLELISKMNFASLLEHEKSDDWFKKIHHSDWNKTIEIHDYFSLVKVKTKAEEFQYSGKFDVLFYDAFGPHAQPELWEQSIFDHLAKYLNKEAILVTYCAQGQFKRNLKAAGFSIERLPGPPGKREMTRGTLI